MNKNLFFPIFILLLINSVIAQVIPVNLNDWKQEGVSTNGEWNVAEDGSYVEQALNGEPTFFLAPDTFINSTIRGTISVRTATDDDFIGFVFGYKRPKGNEDFFDFYLFDWKQFTQSFGGRIAQEGYTLTRVYGTFDASQVSSTPYWNHTDTAMQVIDEKYGAQYGWLDYTEYLFAITYEPQHILITIEGDTIFNIDGEFPVGQFGFYNYSQQSVRYREITLNQFPVAYNDSVKTEFETVVHINILRNDWDPDGDSLTIFHFNQPQNGTVNQLNDSVLVYTPNSDFFGEDLFSYVITDSPGAIDSANVFVTVKELNLSPVALDDSSSTFMNDSVIIAVLENDYDPEGSSLTINRFSQPNNGVVEIFTIDNIQRFEYTPDSFFVGNDTFSYVINDSLGLTDSASVFVSVDIFVSVRESILKPAIFSLHQNYPNPFNPQTVIRYQIPEISNVSLIVYDITGREVAVLLDKLELAGKHSKTFNATGLSSGIYFYTLKTNSGISQTKKMVILK